MKIESAKVDAIDFNSGFVNKSISTDKGIFRNRQIAISNFMYNCELDRLIYEQDVFDCNFQVQHIDFDKRNKCWNYTGLSLVKKHAENYGRIFLIYPQRNAKQLDELTIEKSKRDFMEMVNLFDNVPFQIPLTLTLGEWKKVKPVLLSLLKDNQILVPILSSKHDLREFPLIIKEEIGKSSLIGINSYELRSPTEIINLSYLREINRTVKIGEQTSFFINFGHPRSLMRISNFPSCFGFSFFGGDIFSERATFIIQMYEKTIKSMFNRKPSEYLMYDSNEKKFNKSPQQKGWYGEDLTRMILGGISVNQGLNGYQVHKWVSQYLLQKELDKITLLVSQKSNIEEYVKNYTGWSVFLTGIKVPLISNQKELPK